MSPGQRKYIERRLAKVEMRQCMIRPHLNKPDTPEWMLDEWPELETKADALRARLT
jgi:hypothetical protein